MFSAFLFILSHFIWQNGCWQSNLWVIGLLESFNIWLCCRKDWLTYIAWQSTQPFLYIMIFAFLEIYHRLPWCYIACRARPKSYGEIIDSKSKSRLPWDHCKKNLDIFILLAIMTYFFGSENVQDNGPAKK